MNLEPSAHGDAPQSPRAVVGSERRPSDQERLRILVVSPKNPYPLDRGDMRRVFHLVDALSRVADVILVCPSGSERPPLEHARVVWAGGRPGRVGTALSALGAAGFLPYSAQKKLLHALGIAVGDELRSFRPHVVQFETLLTVPHAVVFGPRAAHVHLDLIDAISLRLMRESGHLRSTHALVLKAFAAIAARQERLGANLADSVSLVAASDARMSPHLREAEIIPNGVDLVQFPFSPPADGTTLIFFGNLGYTPNVRAAQFVADEVLPRLRVRVPEASLRIVGADPDARTLDLAQRPGVEVLGPVRDIGVEIRRHTVAMLPMVTGTGIKNKVLEAFASGTPVLTNGPGIDGITGAIPGRHYIRGETAEELADAACRLFADRRQRIALAAAAHELVQRDFTWANQAARLVAIFQASRRR